MTGNYFDVHLVWLDPQGGSIYLAGEEDITLKFIEENNIHGIIACNKNVKFPYIESKLNWYAHLPFNDAPPSQQFKGFKDNAVMAVAKLRQAMADGENVIVHCHAGVHRSPAVVYVTLKEMGYFENTYDAYVAIRHHRNFVAYYKKLVKWIELNYERDCKKILG